MGTNYYLELDVCESCKKGTNSLHIGKSSHGWCFSLHVIPEEGINNLEDWISWFNKDKTIIRDEYGNIISFEKMLDEITNRKKHKSIEETYATSKYKLNMYNSVEEFHKHNMSFTDEHTKLLRHRVDGIHCIGNGEGTYDFIRGDFS